jgi:hypothetical protein
MCCCALLLFIHVPLLLTQTWWTWGTASGPGSGEQLELQHHPAGVVCRAVQNQHHKQLQLT